MKMWNRSAFSWNYRRANHEGLKTNELEPTAYPGCFLLSRVSSASQEYGAGVMQFDFALLHTQLKDDGAGSDVRRKLGQLIIRLSNVQRRVLEETEEKNERMTCDD